MTRLYMNQAIREGILVHQGNGTYQLAECAPVCLPAWDRAGDQISGGHDGTYDFVIGLDLSMSIGRAFGMLAGESEMTTSRGATVGEPTSRGAAPIVEQVAQAQADKGVSYLQQFMTPDESRCLQRQPDGRLAIPGTAVHRATAAELNARFPGEFQYRTRGMDFADLTTGELIELTTINQVAAHAARPGYPPVGSDQYAFYELP